MKAEAAGVCRLEAWAVAARTALKRVTVAVRMVVAETTLVKAKVVAVIAAVAKTALARAVKAKMVVKMVEARANMVTRAAREAVVAGLCELAMGAKLKSDSGAWGRLM